jgi:hypothetical protein
MSVADLHKVSAARAKAVVVLADYSIDADMSDARAVRCVLALRAGIAAVGHTVVELRDVDNMPTLELVTSMPIVGGGPALHGEADRHAPIRTGTTAGTIVRTLVPHDIIGRTCRSDLTPRLIRLPWLK